ncbi:MAG: hypothetical protein KF745_01710 [Phycisphaeraceae bacterium]|nr:hypothetical protein [Phycisphaeraceae bacterium]
MPRPLLMLLAAALFAAAPGCKSTPTTGPCPIVYRFENVHRQGAKDEWLDIIKVLNRYTVKPVPAPKVTDVKTLPGKAEVRTCEVAVTLPSMADIADVELELQNLNEARRGAHKLEFSLDRAVMTYRSNFVAAGLDVTLRGITNPGFIVGVFLDPADYPVVTRATRSGNWSIPISAVPETRSIYGYSRDPDRSARTRYFVIDVNTMRQEFVSKSQYMAAVDFDPDNQPPPKPTAKADDW